MSQLTEDPRLDVLRAAIRDVPDFPKPGILFKDIHPLLQNPEPFRVALDLLEERARAMGATRIIGIESRGFIFGAPLADRMGLGFSLIRKPGKLPYKTVSESYALEYGTDTIEMHVDAVEASETVVIVDDLLATGGTAEAAVKLVERAGAQVAGCLFLVELGFLKGRERFAEAITVDAILDFG